MKRRLRRPRKPPPLMLTSLLDMFTILLIFLLVSFEAEDYELRLQPDLKLPDSTARSVFKPAVNLAVTRNAVLVESQPVAMLVDGAADPAWHVAQQIPAVVAALRPRFEAREALADAMLSAGASEEAVTDPLVLLQADRDLDYKTLYLVMRSAREAGFSKFRLAVMKK